MTASLAQRRARRGPVSDPETTPAGYLAAAFEVIAATALTLTWPNPKYQTDPVGFARDILGIDLWSKQIEILESVRDNKRTSVRSGHKCGKSTACAVLALWFFCSFPRARVFMTGPTFTQVDDVLWREIKILIERSGTCLACRAAAEQANQTNPAYPHPCPHSAVIPEEPHVTASGGLKSHDHREIVGTTADKPEAMAGRSGVYILYIVDEASGVNDEVFRVIHGNLASIGARSVYISNPTRTEGAFWESQTTKKDQHKVIVVSTEEAATHPIPGLADPQYLSDTAALYGGKDTAEYFIRVLGEFAPEHTTKIIPRSLIDEAFARWVDTPDNDGPLQLGVDVARYGDDDTVIAVRRGRKILELIPKSKLSALQCAELVVTTADAYREPRENVTIVIDSAGVGLDVVIELNRLKSRFVHIIPIHPGALSRLKDQFHLVRDQLWFRCLAWLREEGALPRDERLAAELHAPIFRFDDSNRKKVESKDITRKQLKRSPDRADAVCLAVWNPGEFAVGPEVAPHMPSGRGVRDPVYDGVPRASAARDPVYGPRSGDSVYGRR